MEKNLKQIAWKEAATGGLYLGLIFVVIQFLGYGLRSSQSSAWLPGLLNFAALLTIPYIYAHRMAVARGAAGFTYGQSIGFILRMMLFAGILSGIGQFVLQNYIDPRFYLEQFELALQKQGFSESLTEQIMSNIWILKNPFMMISSGILGMLIYGGVIGLFVSTFVRRPSDPFADHDRDEPRNHVTDSNTSGNDAR